MKFRHYSVVLKETIEQLQVRPDGIYLDGTLGGGGHAEAVAKKLSDEGRLFGIDQDEAAIEAASKRLEAYRGKVMILRNNYRNAVAALRELGVEGVDGIVLDLGVSSYQFDEAERGFSYRYDTALDMRMDQRSTLSAKEIVNGYSESELFHIIKNYGEEPFAKNIAKHIARERKKKGDNNNF